MMGKLLQLRDGKFYFEAFYYIRRFGFTWILLSSKSGRSYLITRNFKNKASRLLIVVFEKINLPLLSYPKGRAGNKC